VKNIFLKIFVLFLLVGCSRVFEVDNELSDKFIGKTFCTKETLFVWKWGQDQTRNFYYDEYMLIPPLRDEKTEIKHRNLLRKRFGFDVKGVILVEQNSRFRVTGVFYHWDFPSRSQYVVMAKILGLKNINKRTNVVNLILPMGLNKGDESKARFNEDYIGKCDD
jgi:hypothetical protein